MLYIFIKFSVRIFFLSENFMHKKCKNLFSEKLTIEIKNTAEKIILIMS